MAAPKRYYYHDIGPYAYQWDGIPRPPSRAGASTSLTGLGSDTSGLPFILGIAGLAAVAFWLLKR